jgi:aminoglycoside phosphotransferase family enzyme/predicted kinase
VHTACVTSDARGELVEAMSRAEFYPHRPNRVELIETHISWVFLAGPLAYKVKKPVVFPFLDYGTLERRRELCLAEVRLNRRLAPSIYLGVRALVSSDGEWELSAEPNHPQAGEYAVEMRRFERGATLDRLLARGRVGVDEIRALGRRLGDFHRQAASVEAPGGWPGHIARSLNENFETLVSFADQVVSGQQLAAAERFSSAFLVARRAELARRACAGRVRDCHGDLRAEHVVFGEHGVEVFDAVEFSPALREIDVAADLAFLVMDLAAAERDDLAGELVAAYREIGGDPGDDTLLAFFAVYRAWVRAKVACLRADELEDSDGPAAAAQEDARGLARLARRLAWRARGPLVLVLCGGTASGKSHLARHLAGAAGLSHLNSDVVRKELLGMAITERAPASAYTAAMNGRTYTELGSRSLKALSAGRPVLVDATFRYRSDRERFAAGLAGDDHPRLFVECRAPAAVLAERAAARERQSDRVSDAAGQLIDRQQREFEPLDEVSAAWHLPLRTDRPVAEIADDVEALLDARLASA